jgi:hypothetical protein
MRIRIRDLFDPGSGINISDPQNWIHFLPFSRYKFTVDGLD